MDCEVGDVTDQRKPQTRRGCARVVDLLYIHSKIVELLDSYSNLSLVS